MAWCISLNPNVSLLQDAVTDPMSPPTVVKATHYAKVRTQPSCACCSRKMGSLP